MPNSSERRNHRKAFTLVELLVVIALIALIVTIMVPALRGAFERGNQAKCKSNLRNIALAMIAFADDHSGHLPGSFGNGSGPEDWQKSFMGNEVSVPSGPDAGLWGQPSNFTGTLVPYLPVDPENARAIYRCPSLRQSRVGSGEGSNGMFDYLFVQAFSGAMISRIPTRAAIYLGQSAREREMGTPLVVEGDPRYFMNSSRVEPGYAASSKIGTHHADFAGFYATIDGRVEEIRSPDEHEGPESQDWKVRVGREWRDIHQSTAFGKLPWDPSPNTYDRVRR